MKLKPDKKKCRKIQYASAKEAYAVRDKAGPSYGPLKAYRCPYCPGHPYHLGHPKEDRA